MFTCICLVVPLPVSCNLHSSHCSLYPFTLWNPAPKGCPFFPFPILYHPHLSHLFLNTLFARCSPLSLLHCDSSPLPTPSFHWSTIPAFSSSFLPPFLLTLLIAPSLHPSSQSLCLSSFLCFFPIFLHPTLFLYSFSLPQLPLNVTILELLTSNFAAYLPFLFLFSWLFFIFLTLSKSPSTAPLIITQC